MRNRLITRRRLGAFTMLIALAFPAGCPGERAAPSPSSSPSLSAPVGSPVPVTPGPAPGVPIDALARVPWEGGPAYYERFPRATAAGWARPDFFPVGVWYEAVTTQRDIDLDRAAGLNTYFELTPNSDLDLVRRAGMTALPSEILPGHGAETVGWLINDEVDMWARAGDAAWTGSYPGEGPLCKPEDAGCGWTVMNTLSDRLPAGDGRMRYANFGKGVMMWLDDADAARFVNDWTDIVSTDIYWYTDGNICGEAENFLALPREQCRSAASYGHTMDRTRKLDAQDGRLQPVLAFVQVGWPAEGDHRTIEQQELAGAVMNSIIHEARGIIYFNHNFGGDCITQHVLRDACGTRIRPTVTELNRRIHQLAPVLNIQSLAHTFNPALDTMLKQRDGSYYIFAMPGPGTSPGPYSLTLPAGLVATDVEVLFEGRTVPINSGPINSEQVTGSGSFTDTFDAEHAYHIYKITP